MLERVTVGFLGAFGSRSMAWGCIGRIPAGYEAGGTVGRGCLADKCALLSEFASTFDGVEDFIEHLLRSELPLP